MAVFTEEYTSLVGAPRTVTVAHSKPTSDCDGDRCLIIGTDQIVNLSTSIMDTKVAHISGIFFHGITTQEIADELSSQTCFDAEYFKTVIISPSESDISSNMDADSVIRQIAQFEVIFPNSSLYITDYIITPKLICMGYLGKLGEVNNLLGTRLNCLKLADQFLENNDGSMESSLPIPLLEFFCESDNNKMSTVTNERLSDLFLEIFLPICISTQSVSAIASKANQSDAINDPSQSDLANKIIGATGSKKRFPPDGVNKKVMLEEANKTVQSAADNKTVELFAGNSDSLNLSNLDNFSLLEGVDTKVKDVNWKRSSKMRNKMKNSDKTVKLDEIKIQKDKTGNSVAVHKITKSDSNASLSGEVDQPSQFYETEKEVISDVSKMTVQCVSGKMTVHSASSNKTFHPALDNKTAQLALCKNTVQSAAVNNTIQLAATKKTVEPVSSNKTPQAPAVNKTVQSTAAKKTGQLESVNEKVTSASGNKTIQWAAINRKVQLAPKDQVFTWPYKDQYYKVR